MQIFNLLLTWRILIKKGTEEMIFLKCWKIMVDSFEIVGYETQKHMNKD